MDATHRQCTKCGETKALTEFSPHAHGKYGRQSRCKQCHAQAISARYWANHATMKEKSRLRALRDQERNPERRRAQRDAWRRRNPELERKIKREWNRAHPEYVRENHKRRDRGKNRVACANYRARKLGNGGTHTKADVDALLTAQSGRCAYCSVPLNRFHVDHRTPLARGGSNGPENLQLLCPWCNRSKGARTHEEYMDQAMIDRLKVLDKASQEQNRAALLAQREKDGHLTVKCGKCGAESVMDKNRPAKAPTAKCGNCGEAL